ncbi:MAG: HDIG domain-containing protein [Candidatus Lokiarchaeota archaeon]|nr:HDIG domain-containing protein [Candidatus Lokiarchaeota archaeon]MBD3200608.1 HDIG domain-containing protein [Candidatus Lokiarchaeota archaeon]
MVSKETILPDRAFALELLKKLRLPISIRLHSINVANKGLEIAENIRKVNVDTRLVEIGGLLHDIGRTRTHGFEHALIGGKIIRERGLPKSLARICETHILGGLDKEDAKTVGLPIKDYLPETIEEKIVCLADKQMMGDREVSIDARFEKWFSKYGKTKLLIKSRERIKKIEKEIKVLI